LTDNLLITFRDRLSGGITAALRADIEQAVVSRRSLTSGHADWGRLCEEAGLLGLGFSEFQLAVRDDPRDAQAVIRLAQHYRERGDAGRAVPLLERLLENDPSHEEWLALLVEVLAEDGAAPRARGVLERAVRGGLAPERAAALARGVAPAEEDTADEGDFSPGSADCVRFQSLFAGREDIHARQWAGSGGEGGYSPVNEPLTAAVVRNHLFGTYTVGVYPIRLDGTCTFFALDLDIDKATLEQAHGQPAFARQVRDTLRAEARRLLDVLRGLGFSPLFEDSGYKGRHYWVFLEQPETAEVLHQLGRQFLAWQTPQVARGLHLEFFPKQGGRRGKGLGNLIKLPLGIHRRTGRRSAFLESDGRPVPEPLAALRRVVRLPRSVLHAALDQLKALPATAAATPLTPGATPPTGALSAAGPPPPAPAAAWTEADFDTDGRVRHLLAHCPVLTELKRLVDDHRSLGHEEQLVLIHSLGHVPGGPQAVNYLLGRCVDVGPEKFLKDRLKGNPVSCPSIRKKIGHVTRRVSCNCVFDFAPDRYPSPVLHLLTLPAAPAAPTPGRDAADIETLARRYAAILARREEIDQECATLKGALVASLRILPDRAVSCPGGRYRLREEEGVEEVLWEPAPPPTAGSGPTERSEDHAHASGHRAGDAHPPGRRNASPVAGEAGDPSRAAGRD